MHLLRTVLGLWIGIFRGLIQIMPFFRWKGLFKQKSGVLGVMHNLTKRNRLVSKHGRINAYTRDDGQQNHRFLKDFFTSTIDMSWSVIFLGFAASFFLSPPAPFLCIHSCNGFLSESERASERERLACVFREDSSPFASAS